MRFKRTSAVVAMAAAAISVVVMNGGEGSASPAISTQPIVWAHCTSGIESALGFDCGFLTVPLDYANPGTGLVKIAVSRRRHTSSQTAYQGVMIMNPGGPGGSGLWMPMMADYFPTDVAAQYDWIGFDPRGVGNSTPSLTCDAKYTAKVRPSYVPTTAVIENAWMTRVQGYAAACGKKYSVDVLSHMSTADSVQDMESLRIALNQPTINYYGYSYGTYLGQAYATQYSNRIRRMVLDSNVGPSGVWEKSNLEQDVAFERVMQKFFGWIATYDRVYHLGNTKAKVEAKWYSTLTGLKARPAGGGIGPSEMTDIYLNAGYMQVNWPQLGTMWSNWIRHDQGQPLVDFYGGGGDDNEYAAYLGTLCVDAPWNRTWSAWKSETVTTYAKAPFETWGNAWYNAPCAWWTAPAHAALAIGSASVAPFLLLDHTLDGATPFAGSLEARQLFPNARLVATVGGTDHAVSPDGNSCVDDRVASYLRSGIVMGRLAGNRADVNCQPLSLPVPDQLGAGLSVANVHIGGLSVAGLRERAKVWRTHVPRS